MFTKVSTLALASCLACLSVPAVMAQTGSGTPAAKSPRKAAPAARPKAPGAAGQDLEAAKARLARDRAEVEQLRGTTLGLIRLMVEQGVLTLDQVQPMLDPAARAQLADVAPKARPAPAAPGPAPAAAADTPAPSPAPAETPPAEARAEGGEAAPAQGGRRRKAQTVRVPYVPEVVKDEIREQIKQEVIAQAKSERWAEPGTLPEWLDRIAWDGDLRLRYQRDLYQDSNISPAQYGQVVDLDPFNPSLTNTRNDHGQWRMRLRLGMLAKISETLGAGIRIATGSPSNPVSTNVTLGRGRDGQGGIPLTLDRAYLKWDPSAWFSASAGRMPNPWFWPTDLVWDEDLNFEGLAASVKPQLAERTTMFATAGAFPLQTQASTPDVPAPKDKWLLGIQAGGEWANVRGLRVKLGAALFEYQNIEGVANPASSNPSVAPGANDWSRPFFRQKGNSRFNINENTLSPGTVQLALASKFRLFNLGGELDFPIFDPFVVKVAADYVRNLGFDQAEIRARTGQSLEAQTDGYQARITLGRDAIRALHDWQVFFGYRRLERDAVLDAFTDSDFYLGGTNTRGFFVGGFYGLDRNAFLRLRYLMGDAITPYRVGTTDLPLSIDVMQADLNVRF